MKKVYILGMYSAMASTIIGPMDIFYEAGVSWNYFNKQDLDPFFDVNLVTSTGKPFRCVNGVRMVPKGSIYDIGDADLIVVSSILDIDRTLEVQGEVVDWLQDQYAQGAHIATICSGAFVLAETGLLDGKSATTHWAYAEQFQDRYPKIQLKSDQLITDENDLFCSGGFNAGIDLSLYLIEKYCGHEVALQSSKSVISDVGRTSQAPYAVFRGRKNHHDVEILDVQEWIEDNFEQNFNYEILARNNSMSRRTLERRFKAATGETPLSYQQRLRIEKAKRLLEKGNQSFEEITYQVGYEDSSSFRKIFHKQTQLTPTGYRKKFQRITTT